MSFSHLVGRPGHPRAVEDGHAVDMVASGISLCNTNGFLKLRNYIEFVSNINMM